MITIYRGSYDSKINVFHGREHVTRDEVVIVENANGVKGNTVARPNQAGRFAFGGTFLFTSNGVFPEFNKPVPLHDRDMNKESRNFGDMGGQ